MQCAAVRVPKDNGSLVLTNIAQVRALSPAGASNRVPVRLQGVVLEKGAPGFVIQDRTAALYAEGSTQLLSKFNRGDVIRMVGMSNPGQFAPYVDAEKVWNIGVGEIPKPQVPDPEELFSGQLDAQWIEVSGIVHRIDPARGGLQLALNLENGGERILAQADITANAARKAGIVIDSTLRLRGVCFYQFNEARQALMPYLSIPTAECIAVTKPAVTNLDALPVRPVESLTRFAPTQTYAHRLRVRGIVLFSQPGESLWIRDGGNGIRVLCGNNEALDPGTQVDVFGFRKRGESGLIIEDAIIRKTGKMEPAPPLPLKRAAAAFNHDSDLVECEAVIQQRWMEPNSCVLELLDGSTAFSAVLYTTNNAALLRRWLPGSRICVTGICQVRGSRERHQPGLMKPAAFQLLLRSPADIVILRRPSWWNAEHVAWVAGGVATALLAVVAIIVWVGHRRLREQAAEQLKAETEFAAILNERNRMAREIHDTLSQGLSAISMQLEVVKRQLPPESKVRDSLEVARTLARTNMTAARKAIWNVRSQDLENGDLATALGDVLKNLTEGTETKGEVRVTGKLRRFAPVTDNNLLRSGQEAVTNAAKYAQAENIFVTLDFGERQFRMSVEDDGKGFDVQSPPTSEGGFGLKAMRERAAQLHAEFSVTSEPGRGTVVMLVLPLSP